MVCSSLDLLIIIIYLFGIRALGVLVTSHRRSLDQYLLAGRKLNGWTAGLSLVGTSISSVTFLAYPADAFKANWMRLLPSLMLPVAIVIMARWWLVTLRGEQRMTAYELLEKRYGFSVRVYGAFAFVISQLVRVSIVLYLVSLVVQQLIGIDPYWCVLLMGGLVTLYTAQGGLEAVVWTDVIQVIILSLGGLLCLWWVIELTPGGVDSLLQHALRDHKFHLGSIPLKEVTSNISDWSVSLSKPTSLMMLGVGLIHWLTEYVSNQSTLQRLYATRTVTDARQALWICVGLSIPLWILFMLIGTALYGFFIEHVDTTAQMITHGELQAEALMPHFITHYLPQGISGMVIAAALAAAMSSLDSSLNAIASVVTSDLYLGYVKQNQDQLSDQDHESALQLARWITLGAAFLMIGGALLFLKGESTTLRDLLITLSALLSGGLLSLYLLALSSFRFSLKISTQDIWIGIMMAGLSTAWIIFNQENQGAVDAYYSGLISNFMLLIGVAFSVIFTHLYRVVFAKC